MSQYKIQTDTINYLKALLNLSDTEAKRYDNLLWVAIPESPSAKESQVKPVLYRGSILQHIGPLSVLNQGGYGVFLTINEVAAYSRKTADILRIRALYADLDLKDTELSYEVVGEHIRSIAVPPTIISATGHGYHLYWVMPEPIEANSESIETAKAQMQGIQIALAPLGADPAVCEVARILRVPGFSNMKATPRPVTLFHTESYQGSTDTLLAQLAENYPYTIDEVYTPGQNLELSVSQETLERATAWLEAKPPSIMGDGGNSALMSACRVGPCFALPFDVAEDLMHEIFNPICEPEWSPEEIERALTSSYSRAEELGQIGCLLPEYRLANRSKILQDISSELEAGKALWGEIEDAGAPEPEPAPYDAEDEVEEPTKIHNEQERQRSFDKAASTLPLTEIGLVERLKLRYRDHLIYWDGQWYYYHAKTGKWVKRTDAAHKCLVKTIARISQEIKYGGDKEELFKWSNTLSRCNIRQSVVRYAASMLTPPDMGMHDRETPFTQPGLHYINFQNGVVNLQTGELLPHDPSYHFLYSLPFDYDPNATCPTWERFLSDVFLDDAELVNYVRNLMGCTLLANTDNEFAVWLYGEGSNGKSTFLETLQYVLGPLAQQVPNDLLLSKRHQNHPTDMARLEQVRFATCSDISLNSVLDEQTYKRLVSTGKVVARYMHRDNFEFVQTHKFWLAVNNLPQVHDESHGTWRRMVVIPFLAHFSAEKRDPTIKGRLLCEAQSIWTWLIRAALDYSVDLINNPPEIVREEVAKWRNEEDWWHSFTHDHIDVNVKASVPFAFIYEAYEEWRKNNPQSKRLSSRAFAAKLQEKGFEREKRGGIVFYNGLSICRYGDAFKYDDEDFNVL